MGSSVNFLISSDNNSVKVLLTSTCICCFRLKVLNCWLVTLTRPITSGRAPTWQALQGLLSTIFFLYYRFDVISAFDKNERKGFLVMPTSFVLMSFSYMPEPDDKLVLDVAYQIYKKFGKYPEALRVALRMDNTEVVQILWEFCVSAWSLLGISLPRFDWYSTWNCNVSSF